MLHFFAYCRNLHSFLFDNLTQCTHLGLQPVCWSMGIVDPWHNPHRNQSAQMENLVYDALSCAGLVYPNCNKSSAKVFANSGVYLVAWRRNFLYHWSNLLCLWKQGQIYSQCLAFVCSSWKHFAIRKHLVLCHFAFIKCPLNFSTAIKKTNLIIGLFLILFLTQHCHQTHNLDLNKNPLQS